MEKNQKEAFNPTAYLTFVFAMQVILTWCTLQGIFTGETYLLSGLVNLVCYPLYVIGSRQLAEMGDDFSANLYYIFGLIFGGCFGVISVAQYFSSTLSLGLEPTFIGIPMLLGGLLLLPGVPSFVYLPWSEALTWTIVTIWLILGGIDYFIGSNVLFLINKWLCFATGVLVFYMSIRSLMQTAGINLPAGKPLRSYSEEKF